ncbi:peptidase C45 acyl-coenzyme A:6-aminopenicillanic acid acyl-transferase-like protein [Xylaria intraflava]|nr:peptidase C45 acyl-coenzyme A:6-aminopenicillanic acid acyl-transferase-like protein [Xylaria intraflava]
MLEIRCRGTPYEIGLTHGSAAKGRIASAIGFYSRLFQESCSLAWPEVTQEAAKYVEPLENLAPRYLEEIRGIAAGSGTTFLDILALNIRSEIMFGLFSQPGSDIAKAPSDGCTSIAWKTPPGAFLAQNWDWDPEQAPNLVVCHVSQPDTDVPDFAMVTEAGIIGKIGLNADGTGCCLNAVKCRGVDQSKLPVHFALRRVLESRSRAAAVAALQKVGVAGSCHIMIADATGATGLECTRKWVREVVVDDARWAYHTNHLLANALDAEEAPWLADSTVRLARARELTGRVVEPSVEAIAEILRDTDGFPVSINRAGNGDALETLFTIVMDLVDRSARITFGRPTDFREQVTIAFEK